MQKENEGKPQNMPKVEARCPSEDVPQEAEGNPQPSEGISQETGSLRGGLTQPGLGFKEDTPMRHLDLEEIIRGLDEWERLKKEIRRVRNKFAMMHWKQRHSCSCSYPVCSRP
ncbi:transcription elongation factor A protein-like 8 [Panthera onca]